MHLLLFIVVQPILVATKVDLRAKNVAKNKEVHFIMIKGGHTAVINVYTLIAPQST